MKPELPAKIYVVWEDPESEENESLTGHDNLSKLCANPGEQVGIYVLKETKTFVHCLQSNPTTEKENV